MHVGGEKELFSVETSQNDVIWETKRQSSLVTIYLCFLFLAVSILIILLYVNSYASIFFFFFTN